MDKDNMSAFWTCDYCGGTFLELSPGVYVCDTCDECQEF